MDAALDHGDRVVARGARPPGRVAGGRGAGPGRRALAGDTAATASWVRVPAGATPAAPPTVLAGPGGDATARLDAFLRWKEDPAVTGRGRGRLLDDLGASYGEVTGGSPPAD
ncbi:MAG: hypothetical protein U5R31_03950 [Acidimicrobiia bacterium]|nr:hypothetical protein [Acidimicrobiia bacterium]